MRVVKTRIDSIYKENKNICLLSWIFEILTFPFCNSLFDLRYQISRSGLPAPSEWGRMLKQRLHPLDDLDPWSDLGPSPDPLLLFTTTSCCVSSPPVQVLMEFSAIFDNILSSVVKLFTYWTDLYEHHWDVKTYWKYFYLP